MALNSSVGFYPFRQPTKEGRGGGAATLVKLIHVASVF